MSFPECSWECIIYQHVLVIILSFILWVAWYPGDGMLISEIQEYSDMQKIKAFLDIFLRRGEVSLSVGCFSPYILPHLWISCSKPVAHLQGKKVFCTLKECKCQSVLTENNTVRGGLEFVSSLCTYIICPAFGMM